MIPHMGENPHTFETSKKHLPVTSTLGKNERPEISEDRGNTAAKKTLTQLTGP